MEKSVNVTIENRSVDGDENNKKTENVSDDSRSYVYYVLICWLC